MMFTTVRNTTRNHVQRHLVPKSRQPHPHQHQHQHHMMSSSVAKFGLGAHKWAKTGDQAYAQLVATSLQHGVTMLEAGQEGGDAALAQAYRHIAAEHPQVNDLKVTMTMRVGYRTLVADTKEKLPSRRSSDVLVEEVQDKKGKFSRVLHNISAEYLQETIQQSPLVELQHDFPIDLRVLVHNPEAQVQALLHQQQGSGNNPSLEERQDYIWSKLQSSLEGLEWAVSQKFIASHGIVSNGLGLPSKHPMHMPSSLILKAKEECPTYFTTVQLPANLLERQGITVARQLHKQHPDNFEIFAMRPLTCYPDLGTGTGHPFGLVDFSLPGSEDPTTHESTHGMKGPPAIYQVALQTAMSHFDADHILEAKEERALTTEERETLDGCKLCQSMLHDLDNGLETVRSFAAHEDELYTKIIPVIYDTFEDFDETTGEVLQAFFAAYGVAVRYAIAKRTRQLLLTGGDDGSGIVYDDLPKQMKLQDYALRQLLAEPAFTRLVIGASSPRDLLEDLDIVHKIATEGGSPLDAIKKLKEEQDQVKEVAAREDMAVEEVGQEEKKEENRKLKEENK